MKTGRILFLITALSVIETTVTRGQDVMPAYRVETLETPPGIRPEVSALTFSPDGRLVACFRLGTIWTLDLETRDWRRFASGLFWPLGILPGQPGEFFVAQAPELTRVADTDGDGRADIYETICDDWGLSGNYHEFVSNLLRDAKGNFYLALGCASTNGALRPPLRGSPSAPRKGRAYGHISPVPYRGWVIKVAPDGRMEPLACGFRQPNGIAFNASGELFVADNQGDWVGTSPLYHLRPKRFYGHPASLVWDRNFDFEGHPLDAPPSLLASRRTPPAVQLPQKDLAGSIGQPVRDLGDGKFGPYSGQLFVSDWTFERIHRIALEKVGGEYQGACFSFLEGQGLANGSNRMAFGPDGNLYVAQVSQLWGGTGQGIQRIVWNGKTPMDILDMHLTPTGFELRFTRPVQIATAASPSAYSLKHYHYLYHSQYGSPQQDVTPVSIHSVKVTPDGLRVRLECEKLVPQRVYELRPRGIRGQDGEPLLTRLAAYTVNRLAVPE